MNTRLGRGLGALIPSSPAPGTTTLGSKSSSIPGAPPAIKSAEAQNSQPELAAVPGASFAEIEVDKITPNPKQPRTVFDEEAMEELVHSVKEIGLLQPIVVRKLDGDQYELVMGERRWRATQAAGLATIPAIVRDTSDDAMLRDASSTRWKKPRRTSRCSTTSGARRRSWRRESGDRGRRSPTRCAY
jgi:ParB family transcriptional regulator, chromosome partitioning protein